MKIKFLITILCSISISTLAFSQDYMDEIVLKACECSNSVSDSLDSEKFNMKLGLCIIDAATPYEKQLKKDYDIDLNKIDTQGEELGRIIGLKMVSVCPDALMQIANIVNEPGGDQILDSTIEGQITKIEENKFVVFSVKEETGKVTKFYWLTFIETDFNFDFASQYKSLKDKDVRITFISQEFFDYRIAEYRTFNIIQRIEYLF